jgi:lantibiotic modifying enzyme
MRWLDQQDLSLETYPPGLFVGLSGVAWGFQELGLEKKARNAIDLAFQSPLLFEGADLFYGTSGIGLTSLYFFHKTGETHFLEKARQLGNAIIATASSDENGCYWNNLDGITYFGHCHGGSGIALFLLYLYRATSDATYLSYATRALDYEIAHARIDNETAAWDRAKGDSMELPYWRFGSGGVGSTLIRFFSVLGKQEYRTIAEKVANHAVTKYAVYPGQFAGLSGIGEFLIDMFHFTGERRYLDDAFKIADGVLLFQTKRPEGIAFPGEELLRISTDYGTGSAGVGQFLMRLNQPGGRLFFEFDAFTNQRFEVSAGSRERVS